MQENKQSAIWGGATIGLLVGTIMGFVNHHFAKSIIYAVVIGALLGVATNILAWIGNKSNH